MNKQVKLKFKKNQKVKFLTIGICLLICCGIILYILKIDKNDEIYSLESRINAIEKEKKKDQEGITTIGWLKVQGTTIDAPIVSYSNKDAFNEISKKNYLWNENKKEEHFNQVSIFGHNILNLSSNPEIGKEYFQRFDDLMAFVYIDFIKENKYIQYTINNEEYIYKIIGVFFQDKYKLDVYNEENFTEKELKNFIQFTKENTIYDFDVDVNEKDKFITLLTCSRFFGMDDKTQFIVVGRLVRNNEKLTNYEVKENEKYNKIIETIKGDEENEENKA